ncbi:MAG: AmmeMemoRadiSam system protein B [Patescibacteria group bacterium]|nr:AmmeMemoRadiSam system protein B [Patescibacteria group bacterium]
MSFVHAGVVPHSPILLPAQARQHAQEFSKTLKALNDFFSSLAQSKPDILIVLSHHGSYFKNYFGLNTETEFISDFKEFGDLETNLSFKGELGLIKTIIDDVPDDCRTMSGHTLDYGTAVPLAYCQDKKIKLLPIYTSDLSLEKHYQFGRTLGRLARENEKRIAIISSGDLSHRLNKNSPLGYNPKARWFDKRIIKAIETNSAKEIIKLDSNLIEEVKECGLKTSLILLGSLEEMSMKPKLLNYESPAGVGWAILDIK